MDLVIGLLTFVLVLNCAILILLILIQLPKKDAGAGLAFGGAASDALFGAGTGTVLTKVTRHATTFFLVLAFVLSVMQSYRARANRDSILDQLDSRAAATAVQPASVPEQAPTLETAVPAGDATPVTTEESVAPAVEAVTTNAAAAVDTATDAAAASTATEDAATDPAAIPAIAEETDAPAPTPPENP